MADEIYSDGIGNIIVAGGVVRIDFVSLSPTAKDDSGNPVVEFRQRVILSLEAFARSIGKIQDTTNALLKAGLIQQSKPGDEHTAEPIAAAKTEPKGEGRNAPDRKPPFP